MDLRKWASLRFRFIRLERFWGSLIYPLQRDRLERRARQKSIEKNENPVASGTILAGEPTERGARFSLEKSALEIEFLAPDLVRISWTPGVFPVPYGIARHQWEPVAVSFQEKGDRWIVASPALTVIVYPNADLEFQDAAGRVLREESAPCPPENRSNLNNEGWIHRAKLRSEERIYGLGERAAPLDLRTPTADGKPRNYRMWNYDAGGRYGAGTDPLYISIPLYLGLHSQGSYLIFYENSYPATFRFTDSATAEFEGGMPRYYVSIGSFPNLLDRYSELTGRPPLPPRWVFGYHQSRWGYERESVLRETAKEFLDRDIPLHAIHLDIDCLDNFRAFTIDPDRFPNLSDFTRELAERGVRVIAIVNPGVKASRNNRLFQEGREQKVFCARPDGEPILAPVWAGMCAFPDFTDPRARHWWSRQYEYLLDLGIAGFWHDMNEPGAFVLWGDPSLPARSTRHAMEGRGGDHREAHNFYGLLQARAAYEALRDYLPEIRPFIVSRSGWAGLQRYAWTWTGDIETSWSGLRQTIPTVLNLGLSGIPYSGSDIGGFKGDPPAELYIRWFQMSAFMPFCRTHSANNVLHRTPWSFGESTLEIVHDLLRFREKLLPYFYTLARESARTGHPLVRPVFWADPEDPELHSIEDAFLLGDALLVCPIVWESLDTRSLRLPEGDWYDFWSDNIEEGGKVVSFSAPIERIPLLVKAGSLLPMEEDGRLVLHIYPAGDATFTGEVYSDAGEGYGPGRVDRFRITPSPSGFELYRQREGDYPFPYRGIRVRWHGGKLRRVESDGRAIESADNTFDLDESDRVHLAIDR